MIDVSVKRCLLRDLRLRAGYTQEQLARLAGMSRVETISDYERLMYVMSADMLMKLAYILNCSMDDIYEFDIVDHRL